MFDLKKTLRSMSFK